MGRGGMVRGTHLENGSAGWHEGEWGLGAWDDAGSGA
jgi:hypothetical protein